MIFSSLAPAGAQTPAVLAETRLAAPLREALTAGMAGCAQQRVGALHLIICCVAADDLRVSVAQDDPAMDGGRVIHQATYVTVDTALGDRNVRFDLHLTAEAGWLPLAVQMPAQD
ncbi:MAG: hypothetical protein H0X24_14545 [Ktedonobacterales bacterium]|nr:hypothetical protein [Ktedonobacterales bacterium]